MDYMEDLDKAHAAYSIVKDSVKRRVGKDIEIDPLSEKSLNQLKELKSTLQRSQSITSSEIKKINTLLPTFLKSNSPSLRILAKQIQSIMEEKY